MHLEIDFFFKRNIKVKLKWELCILFHGFSVVWALFISRANFKDLGDFAAFCSSLNKMDIKWNKLWCRNYTIKVRVANKCDHI